jgi:hypothetical protein
MQWSASTTLTTTKRTVLLLLLFWGVGGGGVGDDYSPSIYKLCSYTANHQLKKYEFRRKSRGKYITANLVIQWRVVHYKNHVMGKNKFF